ncbi:NUDIX hydrolase [Salinisphaera orenii MK-B5]|uniref:NUDIX hydrolase n=1 Tax=Salinisphaera orenii MK-B5 TaxID=856730 RepID=A0A423PWH8_9GAMM|nr:DUF429 domain-containing protein [Salinisphaera orenii]ROO29872.1 NUDIX hydrolase [Salinisphaera orenii MK-B5]
MAGEPRVIGVDGCRAGWIAATPAGLAVGPTLAGLLDTLGADPARSVVAVDMPIGLPVCGSRDCDRVAREQLGGPRRASVFDTPTRAAVHGAASQAEATRINRAHGGAGVSAQAYNLFDKLREVDRLLHDDPRWRASMVEAHPELSFAAWNGGESTRLQPMPHPKTAALGAFDRLTLVLARHDRRLLEAVRAAHPRKALADDDIADALACLFTAERVAAGRHQVLPGRPAYDADGLPMRICI